jgi:hypothetical protein
MWSRDYSLTTEAGAQALWRLLGDVEGWAHWNDGIASIELDGPLAVGVTFRMTPPGEGTITGGTTVTYRVEVTGDVPDDVAEEVGQAISADFPDILASLVAAARAS